MGGEKESAAAAVQVWNVIVYCRSLYHMSNTLVYMFPLTSHPGEKACNSSVAGQEDRRVMRRFFCALPSQFESTGDFGHPPRHRCFHLDLCRRSCKYHGLQTLSAQTKLKVASPLLLHASSPARFVVTCVAYLYHPLVLNHAPRNALLEHSLHYVQRSTISYHVKVNQQDAPLGSLCVNAYASRGNIPLLAHMTS